MADKFPQAQVLGEGVRQEQAGIGHQAVVVKGDADTVGIVLWQHLLGAPCFRADFCSKTIIPDSEEHPPASSRAVPKALPRWIRDKVTARRYGLGGESTHQTAQRQGAGQGRGSGPIANRRRLTRMTFSFFE